MVNRLLRELQVSLNQVRLESYRRSGDSDVDLIATYLWNVALGESLHPSLQVVEVALRNALHDEISKRHGLLSSGQSSWFDEKMYFSADQVRGLESIRHRYNRDGTYQPSDNQIVSATNMGFWTAVLSAAYERRIWQPLGFNMLWDVFPYAPRGMSLSDHHKAFDDIRQLRNRVNHYERICHRADLVAAHAHIYEAISWMNLRLMTIVDSTDRFNKIHSMGRSVYLEKVLALLDD